MVILTMAGANGGCHGSIFAVVPDFPDAAEYRVTHLRTDVPGVETVAVFNRHERGSLQFTNFPKWRPGPGQIAGLLTSGGLDGNGDDCADIRADYAARFSIKDAVVVRYTAGPPPKTRGAVEVRYVPTPPPNDGPSGKDGCAINLFVSVPKVKGAVRYRVRITQKLVGVLGTSDLVIEPGKLNTKGPTGTKAKPYQPSAGRVGTFYVSLQRDAWGCKNAEWWVAQNIKKVTYKVETT
ncbi:MAG: hypothetical protein LH654_01525 [Thermoleophilia bacterium]|nr:hypothetical protein [Thermoleophilia bacterium]